MRRRIGVLFVAGLVTACSGPASQCPPDSGPESVTIDAAAYADRGDLRICVSSGLDGNEFDNCVDQGTSVSTELTGAYAVIHRYEIYLTRDGSETLVREGSISLTCQESAVTVGFEEPVPGS